MVLLGATGVLVAAVTAVAAVVATVCAAEAEAEGRTARVEDGRPGRKPPIPVPTITLEEELGATGATPVTVIWGLPKPEPWPEEPEPELPLEPEPELDPEPVAGEVAVEIGTMAVTVLPVGPHLGQKVTVVV